MNTAPLKKLATTVSLLALASGTAMAQDNTAGGEPEFAYAIDAAGWRGGAFTRPDGTTFSHCGIGRQYQNGITLLFTRTRREETNLVLLSDQFEMNEQTPAFTVRVQVDETAWDETYPAVPAGATALAIPLGQAGGLIEQLRGGTAMSIRTPLVAFEFALSGTFNALPRLEECIAAANEALPPLPEPESADIEVPEFQGMTRDSLSSLLSAAGLDEVEIVPAEQIPDDDLGLQYAWTLGPIIGGLQQLPRNTEGLSMERFMERFIGQIEERCSGEFGARITDSVVLQDRYAIALAEIQCAGAEDTSYMASTFVLDDNFYSAFFHEGPLENVDMARGASGAIAAVIRRLAGPPEGGQSTPSGPGPGDGEADGDLSGGGTTFDDPSAGDTPDLPPGDGADGDDADDTGDTGDDTSGQGN
ncbi:MAG: hypothetical protein RLO50_05270 [Azospirillaceae bacterium]